MSFLQPDTWGLSCSLKQFALNFSRLCPAEWTGNPRKARRDRSPSPLESDRSCLGSFPLGPAGPILHTKCEQPATSWGQTVSKRQQKWSACSYQQCFNSWHPFRQSLKSSNTSALSPVSPFSVYVLLSPWFGSEPGNNHQLQGTPTFITDLLFQGRTGGSVKLLAN